jgi:hypothetical protein
VIAIAVRHGEQIAWLMGAASILTGAVWGYVGGFLLGRRRVVGGVLGSILGGAAAGYALEYVSVRLRRALEGFEPLVGALPTIRGAAVGLAVGLILAGATRWWQARMEDRSGPTTLTR